MKSYRFLLGFFILMPCAWFSSLSYATDCERIESRLHEGDIIFLGLDSPFFKRVARATNSWVSHVGFAMRSIQGQWIVYESKIPFSTKTPLCQYLKRAAPGEIAVRRFMGELTDEDLKEIRAEAEARLGILYHQGFNYDSTRQFCSKYVHDVFAMALSRRGRAVQIGVVETFADVLARAKRELNAGEYENLLSFWQTWFLPVGGIPFDRRTITPHSLLIDDDLVTIQL